MYLLQKNSPAIIKRHRWYGSGAKIKSEYRPRELMLSSMYIERIQLRTQKDNKEGLNMENNLEIFKLTIRCSSGERFF